MSLHPGVSMIVHEMQQSRDDFVVELLLKIGCEVCGHLAEGVAAGKADAGVLPGVEKQREKVRGGLMQYPNVHGIDF